MKFNFSLFNQKMNRVLSNKKILGNLQSKLDRFVKIVITNVKQMVEKMSLNGWSLRNKVVNFEFTLRS